MKRWNRIRLMTVVAVTLAMGLSTAAHARKFKRYTFGSLLARVSVPAKWQKVKQTTEKLKFRFGKAGSLSIRRKFKTVNIHKVAEAIKAGWRSKGWKILKDKRGKLKGTNHPAFVLRAHHKGAKVKIETYVVQARKRVYVLTFGNLARKFKPKLYNKVMLTFDAI